MEIVKIQIVDYFKNSLDAAYERGFTWVMCLIARDADAEKTYNQIKKYWDSFYDIYRNQNELPMVEMVAGYVNERLEQYLRMLG